MPYPAVRSAAVQSAAVRSAAVRSPAVRSDWPKSGGEASGRPRRAGAVTLLAALASPLVAASVLGALILHLLAGLAARLPASDALGALSIMAGMALVLVTLLPFALLSVRRAHRAWADMQGALRR
ncbi:hypothetical protein [Azospirillum lipoferum]|nr:hypothetical protein [Azospirillum lipoferum]